MKRKKKKATRDEARFDRCEVRRVRTGRYSVVFAVEVSGENLRRAFDAAQSFEVWDRSDRPAKKPRRRR